MNCLVSEVQTEERYTGSSAPLMVSVETQCQLLKPPPSSPVKVVPESEDSSSESDCDTSADYVPQENSTDTDTDIERLVRCRPSSLDVAKIVNQDWF